MPTFAMPMMPIMPPNIIHQVVAPLRVRWLYALLAVGIALITLAASLPRFYAIDVGVEEGYGSDLPLLWGFNTFENDEHGSYRWTQDKATLLLPGMGQRAFIVQYDVLPVSEQVAQRSPANMQLFAYGTPVAILPFSSAGRQYSLLVPPHMLHDGTLALTIRTRTFTPPNDPRHLGAPLDAIRIASVLPAPTPIPLPIVLPAGSILQQWLLALVCFYLLTWYALALPYPKTLRQGAVPHPPTPPTNTATRATIWAPRLLALGVVLVSGAAHLDPPRWGYGAHPTLLTTLVALVMVLLLHALLPSIARLFAIPLSTPTAGWLILIVAIACGIRFGGRLYPLAMWGDIGFHTNRFIDTLGLGNVFLLSRNRGVNFPYPPGPYLTIAPLILTTLDIRLVLPSVAAFVDGISALVVYSIAATVLAHHHHHHHTAQPYHERTALIAAMLYVFTAAGIMLTWWSFDTHIYTQFATLMLIGGMVLLNHHYDTFHTAHTFYTRMLPLFVLFVLLCGVFLGHFGFLINTVLMGGVLLVVVWAAAWRGDAWARHRRWNLLGAYVSAGIVAFALFYSAYWWLFNEQLSAVFHGGFTGLAERAPVTWARLWHTLWEAGFIQHFGFFPLLLLPAGMWLVWCHYRRARCLSCTQQQHARAILMLVVLMLANVLVSSAFAALPFITRSTQNTRWLMFSAWVIAIGAAVAFQRLWRYGVAGKLSVAAMGAFVVWNSVYFWLSPLLWRIRPPEPF